MNRAWFIDQNRIAPEKIDQLIGVVEKYDWWIKSATISGNMWGKTSNLLQQITLHGPSPNKNLLLKSNFWSIWREFEQYFENIAQNDDELLKMHLWADGPFW